MTFQLAALAVNIVILALQIYLLREVVTLSEKVKATIMRDLMTSRTLEDGHVITIQGMVAKTVEDEK